ncbi:MAG: dihydropteroate synthase [Treponema sp.]|nr:dihydropteroate synthase [Candidatus Treponema scatequi]
MPELENKIPELKSVNPSLELKDRKVVSKHIAFVVGIVNANHDSFFKKSRGGFSLAKRLIDEGADILDIGAESSRPGASYISEKDELNALIPLIKKIRKYSDIPISVDTRKKNVIKACVESGADILNDISALEDDDQMASFAAEAQIPVILMHKRNEPKLMQLNTKYDNIVDEVSEYLFSRADFAMKSGIEKDRIILDPGIGFAKDLEGNCRLIKECRRFCEKGFQVMMALSRKSFLGQLTGRKVEDRLSATLTANIYSVLNGMSYLRVHDVKETVDCLKVLEGILK